MKKVISLAMALVMLTAAGCGNAATTSTAPAGSAPASTPATTPASTPASSEAASTPAANPATPEFLEIFSGSMGGSWYTVGAEIATLLQEKIPGLTASTSPGGGAANPTKVQKKEGMLGLIYTGVGLDAYKGVGDYTEAHSDLRHVISLYSMPFLWVSLSEDDSIKTVYDLGTKRISPGRTGQTGLAISKACLAAHGIDMDKVTENGGTVSLLGDSERLNMLRDRNLDAASGLFPLDHSELQSLSLNPGIRLITMDPKVIPELQKSVPGLEAITIQPGTFDKAQTEAVDTVAAVTSLVCNQELDDETVYQITKSIYEESKRFSKYFSDQDSTIVSNPLAGVDESFPIHPGALKFYKEIGLVK